MASLKALKIERKNLRTSITKLYGSRQDFESADKVKAKLLRQKVQEMKSRNAELEQQILAETLENADRLGASFESDEQLEQDYALSMAYNDNLLELEVMLEDIFEKLQIPDVKRENTHHHEELTRLRTPDVPIPTYQSDENEDFALYIRNFEDTIDKYRFNSHDKFVLLRKHVKGPASYLLSALDPAQHSYDEGKKILTDAFAARHVQVSNLMSKMLSLKLDSKDESLKYLGEITRIRQALTKLDVTREEMFAYHILQSLDAEFKDGLIAVTNKLSPSLEDIFANFHAANARYKARKTANKKPQHYEGARPKIQPYKKDAESSSNAVSIRPKRKDDKGKNAKKCYLCGKDDHLTAKCEKYDTPKKKVDHIRNKNGCMRCSRLNHKETDCRLLDKINPCRICGEKHMEFLCTSNKGFQSNKQRNSSAHILGTQCLRSDSSTEAALGTVTCVLKDGSTLRVLRDSGSQSNFIARRCLSETNHRVIEKDVNLTLSGINDQKTYNTSIIEMMFMFEEKAVPVRLFTLEEIPTNLQLSQLGDVVRGFKNRGYNLADLALNENSREISSLDAILGAGELPNFNDKLIKFGKNSAYLDTNYGVVIQGNIGRLISDLPYLENMATVKREVMGVTGSYACALTPLALEQAGRGSISMTDSGIEYERVEAKSLENKEQSDENSDDQVVESDRLLVEYLIKNTTRSPDGRLCMPLLFNTEVKHLLPDNYKLAIKMLDSLQRRFSKKPEKLLIMDETIRDLERQGIIEKIDDIEQLRVDDPSCSFLGHKPIFKPEKSSTKCRIVFLSNLRQKVNNKITLSHNDAMLSGPCMNFKLSTALMQLRFGKKLLCFDLKKAFCQIQLPESDRNKLLFLWFKNVKNEDYTFQAYRNNRLSFGLRPSPTILMVGLWVILMKNAAEMYPHLRDLCEEIYSKIYMDNAAIAMETSEELEYAFNQLGTIFEPYGFELQQFATNDEVLQSKLPNHEAINGLLGLCWCAASDKISLKKTLLDIKADTKRSIQASIASIFDPLGLQLPLLNRAKILLHVLQNNPNLSWDAPIPPEEKKEWINTCNQYNQQSNVALPRCVGNYKDKYNLVGYCDSSGLIYGLVLYLQNKTTGDLHFMIAKNRMVKKQMEKKSIPALELTAIVFAAESALDLKNELSSDKTDKPIIIEDVTIYSDSIVALSWVNAFVHLEKLNKKSPYVRNRLDQLDGISKSCNMTLKFVDGVKNPADCTTRATSEKMLNKTSYFGPKMDCEADATTKSKEDLLNIPLPRVASYQTEQSENATSLVANTKEGSIENQEKTCLPIEKYSSYNKLWTVTTYVVRFIEALKNKLRRKNSARKTDTAVNQDHGKRAAELLLKAAQAEAFPEVLAYLESKQKHKKDMPQIMRNMNLYVDERGLIRVGGKLKRFKDVVRYFPLLLPSKSTLTNLIIWKAHHNLDHANGVKGVLEEVKKQFWVPCGQATVHKILRKCVHCRRYNRRTIKLNQNSYPEFRLNVAQVPFRNIFVDYIGPFHVYRKEKKEKAYILCISCIYTRAISLVCTEDLSTSELLMALQTHSYSFGMPETIRSDLGSQFVSGANILKSNMNTPEVSKFMADRDMTTFDWNHCDKGNSSLASLVESCVKLTKRALAGSIGRSVLKESHFRFFVKQANAVINKRPIAFQTGLTEATIDDAPKAITPEMLIHGRELHWTNIVPGLQPAQEDVYDPKNGSPETIKDTYHKLKRCRNSLEKIYNEEMINHLIEQSVAKKDRYTKVHHDFIEAGDIVLIKEENTKPINYPMGKVRSTKVNSLGEVVGAEVQKGTTREIVKRHATTLIPLLKRSETESATPPNNKNGNIQTKPLEDEQTPPERLQRQAAGVARWKIKQLADRQDDLCCNLTINKEDHDTLISTVMCTVQAPNQISGEYRLRAVQDNGSQVNLIQEDCLENFEHEVISEGQLMCVGTLLGEKIESSKRVGIVGRIGGKTHKFEAHAIKRININLELPGLRKLVHELLGKGYELGDPWLVNGNESISNINLILGSFMAEIPESVGLKFGKSSEIRLAPQVILRGSIANLLRDIQDLPNNVVSGNHGNGTPEEMAESGYLMSNSTASGGGPLKEIINLSRNELDSKGLYQTPVSDMKRGLVLLLPESHNSLKSYQAVLQNVFRFICNLKMKINLPAPADRDYKRLANLYAIQVEQKRQYPELFKPQPTQPVPKGLKWHHHFEVLIPKEDDGRTECGETLLGAGSCRLGAKPIIPRGSNLLRLMERDKKVDTVNPASHGTKAKKKGLLKYLFSLVLAVCVLGYNILPQASGAAQRHFSTHETRMIVDLPSDVFNYLLNTPFGQSMEMSTHQESVDDMLINWLQLSQVVPENEALDQNLFPIRINPRSNAIPPLKCSVEAGCLPEREQETIRTKRFISASIRRLGNAARRSRRTFGKQTGVPMPLSRRRVKWRSRLETSKSIGKFVLKAGTAIGTGYVLYQGGMEIWDYLFGPEYDLGTVIEDLKDNQIKEAVLARNLSFIAGDENELLYRVMEHNSDQNLIVNGQMKFRSFALYALIQEESTITNAVNMLSSNKLEASSKISTRILSTLRHQLEAARCDIWITPEIFNIGGQIKLEGVDIQHRRLFLNIRIPIIKLDDGGRQNEDQDCGVKQYNSSIQLADANKISSLQSLNEKLKEDGEHSNRKSEKLLKDIKVLNKTIISNQKTSTEILKATEIRGSIPNWLSYGHLVMFLGVLLIALAYKGCSSRTLSIVERRESPWVTIGELQSLVAERVPRGRQR